ncbi:hypothetical protein HYS49_03310 [Candidatus Woesearchaeota archaeon]|nr:hypothetical protein [Candidatus Woesearchaeota archaeon]
MPPTIHIPGLAEYEGCKAAFLRSQELLAQERTPEQRQELSDLLRTLDAAPAAVGFLEDEFGAPSVAAVIVDVKKKAGRHSRGGSSFLCSIDGQIILMPRTSTYANGVQALRNACAREPNSPHPTFTRADGTEIYRPLTFKEDLRARVDDFNTFHDASGAERSIDDRLRLFDCWLDSCTGTAYEAGTDRMKIIPVCEPLITIAPDFTGSFLNVLYASLEGPEIDRSKHPHSQWLEKSKLIDDPYWLAAVEEDKPLLREYADIVYAQLLEKYSRTTGMGFFSRAKTNTDELRALFVLDLDNDSVAFGYLNLDGSGSFLRVAQSSSARKTLFTGPR